MTGNAVELLLRQPEISRRPADFGLDDWPGDARAGNGDRELRMHMMYVRYTAKAGVASGGIFTAGMVADRDKWTCAVCGEPVPRRWTAAELGRAPALTFALALGDGGRYDKKNARLAHYRCAVFPDEGLKRRVGVLLSRDLTVKAHAAAGDEECSKGHPLSGANLLRAADGRRRCRRCRNDRERPEAKPLAR